MIICKICIMDSISDPDFILNEEGICNYCLDFKKKKNQYIFSDLEVKSNLELIHKKFTSEKSPEGYDCLTGLSGGVDSSFIIDLLHKLGLNPLVIHFDNGWNSEVSSDNIKKLLNKTNFDYKTIVIDWNEFKSLQRSFLKAGVIDIEILTDHAITASMYKISSEHKIKNIVGGSNFLTEHGMPHTWTWFKTDLRNIKDINKNFENIKLKTFPTLGTAEVIYKKLISKYFPNFVSSQDFTLILNQLNYKKNEAINILKEKYDWIYYGEKHYESVFTEFYQAYILPEKFKIDKRKPHISCLIRNGEITREEALSELNKPTYSDIKKKQRKEFILNKLNFSEKDFDDIMSKKPNLHSNYKSDKIIFDLLKFYRDFFKSKNLFRKKKYV